VPGALSAASDTARQRRFHQLHDNSWRRSLWKNHAGWLLPRDVRYVEDVGGYSGNRHTGFGVAIEPTQNNPIREPMVAHFLSLESWTRQFAVR